MEISVHFFITFSDYKSAFTTRKSAQGSMSGSIRFETLNTNIGGHYMEEI